MTDHRQRARELFLMGYNCAQATLAAFADVTGLSEEESIRLASGFGAGMGGMRGTCGAVTGMFMAADMLYGYTSPTDSKAKAAHYGLIRELAEEFRALNGTDRCGELLKDSPKAQTPMTRDAEYYASRPCTGLVEDAAGILDGLIQRRGLPGK